MNKEEKKKYNAEYVIKNIKRIKKQRAGYRQEHIEETKKYSMKYYQKHKEEMRKHNRKYYQEHKEEIKKCHMRYRQKHPEDARKYYQEHKEEARKWKQSDIGKTSVAKSMAKRKRNLGWTKLFPNPFANTVTIDWHHYDDEYVIALPTWLHIMHLGKNHRELLKPIVHQIYSEELKNEKRKSIKRN